MMLWIIFALMSTAAIVAVLWPLARKPRAANGGSDLVVYQDQLEEIARDRGAGLIGEAEAEAARIEVSRRLITAADASAPAPQPQQPEWRRRATALAVVIVLSLLPVGLYAALGSPEVPGQPAYAREDLPPGHESIAALIAEVEQRLAKNPNDGMGWQIIAPVYLRLGRYDDAVVAFRKSLALNGETAARDSDLGEALVSAANGLVTHEAKQLFERAAARDANDAKANYFLGLAEEQDGHREAAAAKWRAMLEAAPVDAPWVGFVRQALARVSGKPTAEAGLTQGEMAAAQGMPAAQRAAMIRGMVAKLADRLHANGNDVDGWLRLVRAYVVLGDQEKARDAAADAKRALADRPVDVKRIDDLAKSLGLEG
ncbi:MAG: c-type cytochrome biogenesis protein CcmI [Xanthobacteraceae bacterium]